MSTRWFVVCEASPLYNMSYFSIRVPLTHASSESQVAVETGQPPHLPYKPSSDRYSSLLL